jgi:8-oxo-dGTP pyrophosphatase MutT (NUDIX family)
VVSKGSAGRWKARDRHRLETGLMDDYRWKVLRTKLIAELNIRELELPTGRRIDYVVLNYPESVGVLALTERQEVILVGQYRYTIDEYSWEIPCGGRSENESVEDCARRELEEETGYRAGRIDRLPGFHASNATSNEFAHLCLATELSWVGRPAENQEPVEETIQVKPVAFDDVLASIMKGDIHDAPSMIAILLYAQNLRAQA